MEPSRAVAVRSAPGSGTPKKLLRVDSKRTRKRCSRYSPSIPFKIRRLTKCSPIKKS